MKRLPATAAACLLVLVPAAVQSPALAATARPARIVASYRDTEALRVYAKPRFEHYHQVFLRRQGGGQKDTCTIRPSEFANYSAVIMAGMYGTVRFEGSTISPAEAATILTFLQDGGVLAITIPSFVRNFGKGLTGISGRVHVIDQGSKQAFRIEQPGHPLVAGLGKPAKEDAEELDALLDADADEEIIDDSSMDDLLDPGKAMRSRFVVRKIEGAESIAGDATTSCYTVLPVGKGKLVLVPQEVLPDSSLLTVVTGRTAKPEYKAALIKRAQQLTDNLFRYLGTARVGDVIARSRPGADGLAIWHRDIPTITTEGPELLAPPYPEPGEELDGLSMDVGRTEWERRLFFTTTYTPIDKLSVHVSALSGPQGVLAADHADVLALRPPTLAFPGPNVYFGKIEDLPPAGKPFITLVRPASTMWCLRLHVEDAAPGEYAGNVVLNADGKESRLPVRVKVWPVRLDRRYVAHDVEYFFMSRYDYSRSNMAKQLSDYRAAVTDFREHWVNWVLGGLPGYAGPHGLLREDGRELLAAIEEQPERFRGDSPPMLDLSHQDTLFHLFVTNGLSVFRTYGVMGGLDNIAEVAGKVYGTDDLTPDSPETAAVARYWMREHLRYLREKGFPRVYTKIGDEWGEEGLPGFLREARIAKAAGWRVIANPNQQAILEVAEHRDKVWPVTDCWWYARSADFLATAAEMERSGESQDEEFWATQASSFWWNIAIPYGYRIGWELAYLGFPGHHFHGWKRDPPGGVWLDHSRTPYAIFPCVGYELLGEGLEDGQYLAMCREMLNALPEPGDGRPSPRVAFETRLRDILGPGEDAILGFHELSQNPDRSLMGIGWQHRLRLPDFFRAKRELLELLVELKRVVPDPGVDLAWGDLHLVRAGEPAAALRGSETCIGILNDIVEKSTGLKLPTGEASGMALVIVVGVRGEAHMDDLVAGDPRCGVTPRYPKPGSYLVYPAPEGNRILICGGDAVGAELGCRAFGTFLDVRTGWLH